MPDRLVNIFFSLALIFVFILYSNASNHQQILLAVGFASIFSFIAFVANWLTIDGAAAAVIFGTIAYGLAGLTGAAVALGFFISASILSKNEEANAASNDRKFRRNGLQVWANGFWFCLWALFWYITNSPWYLIASVAAIAVSAADTWATEIGHTRTKAKAWLITTGKVVTPGTDGAVSIKGSLAGLTGAFFIAFLFWLFYPESSYMAVVAIGVAGFLGCMIDSYLGARLQFKEFQIPAITVFGKSRFSISNNFVNWLSAGVASATTLILTLILGV